MGIVFLNIDGAMLNHAAGAWIAAAKGINLKDFLNKEPMALPDAPSFCVALVAMISTICENAGNQADRQAFVIVLEQCIANLAVVEGPKRV